MMQPFRGGRHLLTDLLFEILNMIIISSQSIMLRLIVLIFLSSITLQTILNASI